MAPIGSKLLLEAQKSIMGGPKWVKLGQIHQNSLKGLKIANIILNGSKWL